MKLVKLTDAASKKPIAVNHVQVRDIEQRSPDNAKNPMCRIRFDMNYSVDVAGTLDEVLEAFRRAELEN